MGRRSSSSPDGRLYRTRPRHDGSILRGYLPSLRDLTASLIISMVQITSQSVVSTPSWEAQHAFGVEGGIDTSERGSVPDRLIANQHPSTASSHETGQWLGATCVSPYNQHAARDHDIILVVRV
ncbi:hypothetical protein HBI56_068290 [Parastagonospora nodorum]|uniref:Uncharacterized protein n=1 Tax=Phaeosphaeria nodorum (strain SN15 / ATCC MYA-4574 / FGSC 10173) TaxID=321614 RepID=A0A7U2HTH1_PHANO|nr:hypothetical protein HBH56_002790 [Parastagonospora nodorum]QRC90223.1 hypothetical protein JI435_425110 [Parastagonospora nodorum SN15]KAH3938204.1 hypothetical protein HBH54_002790 [Parastagonospora nodorum]KAH3946641.1 hypothetical protein HBH53_129210 [Parastagonospora nodorum]KAH3975234.1 hypothetical protein HBH51_085560 [Parastagonospora nodorum]